MPTATSPAMTAAENLRRMLTTCPTWQQSIADLVLPEDALDSVYFRWAGPDAPRPYAVVALGDLPSWNLIAGGAQNFLRPSGTLFLYMARNVAEAHYRDDLQAEYDAGDFFSQVMTELVERAAADDNLSIIRVTCEAFGQPPEEDWPTLGRFFLSAHRIDWGDGGSAG